LVEHHLGERRIERLNLTTAAGFRHDRARSIEHREQRHATERYEAVQGERDRDEERPRSRVQIRPPPLETIRSFSRK
jgi:hypothetical protein